MADSPPPRLAALDRPALGLVLLLAATMELPMLVLPTASMVFDDLGWSLMNLVMILQLVATGLQIATGIAIARRSWARPLFAAYGVASLATAVSAAIAFGAGDGLPMLGATMIEVVAGPLMILVAPLVFDVRRLADRRSPADAAAVLIVFAVSWLLGLPLGIADRIRLVSGVHGAWPFLLSSAIAWALQAVPPTMGLRAARALLRPGPPAAARRALVQYVVVSIAIGVALNGWSFIELILLYLRNDTASLLVMQVFEIALSVAQPVLIWRYARPALQAPIAVERRELSGPLVWGVLWLVPMLLVRSLLLGHQYSDAAIALTATLGALLFLQAICNLAAVRTAARSSDRGFHAAAMAVVIAVVLLGAVVVAVCVLIDPHAPGMSQLTLQNATRPLTLMATMLAALAWSQRTAPAPELPRATALPE